MDIGIIGCGMVGGSLANYLEKFTDHRILKHDPAKGFKDPLQSCDAIFICIPVSMEKDKFKQNEFELTAISCVARAITDAVFIRSTVLPGTNDRLRTYSMPEFLTERFADQDMVSLDIYVGSKDSPHITEKVREIFGSKKNVTAVKNLECEIGKLYHNGFGAMKVTFFNIVSRLCDKNHIDYEAVKDIMISTGFINEQHTFVPGPDGKYGYGGKCFPENISMLKNFYQNSINEMNFFQLIEVMNGTFRQKL